VTIEMEQLHRWEPMEKLERSSHLVALMLALAERLGIRTGDAATGGASDANTTSGMGVPTIDGLGPIGGLDHAPGEYLEVDSIVPRTTLLAALLMRIAVDPGIRAWRAG
jgi:glutamate carboxypeptidase